MALETANVTSTAAEVIPARVRRGLRITVKSGGPVAFAYADAANTLTFARGDHVAEKDGIYVGPTLASNAIWAVVESGTATISYEEIF